MEGSLRPHRGGSVLALGILGLVPLVGVIPFGIPAWVMGSKDLRGMDLDKVDPSGRKLTQAGRVCGIVGTVLWLMLFPTVALMYGGKAVYRAIDYRQGTVQHISITYPDGKPERNYAEIYTSDGYWAKDGPYVRWTQDGKKLEEGGYHDGRRTGTWTFWNEDGSVDHARSGVYENDVKVRD